MTLIGIENYGSLLQVFATQKKLEKYAENVKFINCIHNLRLADLMKHQHLFKIPFKFIRTILYNKNLKSLKKMGVKLSDNVYMSENEFRRFNSDADIYCTGSDQIWNPGCVSDMPFGPRFLSFIPNGKQKFSYASSFGMDWMDVEIVEKTKNWIHQYGRISVREDSGVKILEEQYGYKNPIRIVDPTLAMTPEFWRLYAPKLKIKKKYILIYAVYINKQFDDYVKNMSKKMGLPLIRICPDIHQTIRCGRSIFIPPVFKFITLIDNAKYIITDSFHGTAFALNLNKEFVVFREKDDGNRISGLLRLVGQEHRYIKNRKNYNIFDKNIDFNHVNNILKHERKRVDDFLYNIFNENKNIYSDNH